MVKMQGFQAAIKQNTPQNSDVAYVVPAFEMKEDEVMPSSKADLIAAWDRGAVRVSGSR